MNFDLIVLEDTIPSISDIPDSSDVLLYNLSAVFHNPYTVWLFNNNSELWFFYQNSDKIVSINHDRDNPFEGQSDFDIILESYETKLDRSIEDIFTKVAEGRGLSIDDHQPVSSTSS